MARRHVFEYPSSRRLLSINTENQTSHVPIAAEYSHRSNVGQTLVAEMCPIVTGAGGTSACVTIRRVGTVDLPLMLERIAAATI